MFWPKCRQVTPPQLVVACSPMKLRVVSIKIKFRLLWLSSLRCSAFAKLFFLFISFVFRRYIYICMYVCTWNLVEAGSIRLFFFWCFLSFLLQLSILFVHPLQVCSLLILFNNSALIKIVVLKLLSLLAHFSSIFFCSFFTCYLCKAKQKVCWESHWIFMNMEIPKALSKYIVHIVVDVFRLSL